MLIVRDLFSRFAMAVVRQQLQTPWSTSWPIRHGSEVVRERRPPDIPGDDHLAQGDYVESHSASSSAFLVLF
jgi:hypothetical protein